MRYVIRGKIDLEKRIRIAVCEDHTIEKEIVKKLLKKYAEQRQIQLHVEYFSSGIQYKEHWTEADEPDILLLDIEMPEFDGIQLKEYLQEKRSKSKILFITSHTESVWDAFGENVYGFLKKPMDEKKFEELMDKMISALQREYGQAFVDEKTGEKIIPNQILWVRSQGQYSKVQMENGEKFSNLSLAEWEEKMKGNTFFRVHRSFIVNLKHIAKITDEIKMDNGTIVPIARRRKAVLKDTYKEFLIHEV